VETGSCSITNTDFLRISMKSYLERGFLYIFNLCRLTSMEMAFSSMVRIRIEPLSLHVSTIYGPHHLVLRLPLKSSTLNHITAPNPLAKIDFLWGVSHAISFFEVRLPLSGEGPAFSVHLIHSAKAIFPVVHAWDLGPTELPNSMCYIQILWTTKPSSHRPAHMVWNLL